MKKGSIVKGWLLMKIYYHTGSMDTINEMCTRQERSICSGLEKNGFDGQKEWMASFGLIQWLFSMPWFNFESRGQSCFNVYISPFCWPCWDTTLDVIVIDHHMVAIHYHLLPEKSRRIGMLVSNITPSFLNHGSPHEYLCILKYNGTNWEGTYQILAYWAI